MGKSKEKVFGCSEAVGMSEGILKRLTEVLEESEAATADGKAERTMTIVSF